MLLKVITGREKIEKLVGGLSIQGNPVVNPGGVPRVNKKKMKR